MSQRKETEGEQSGGIEEYLTDGGQLKYDGWKRALRDEVLLGQSCDACGHLTGAPKAACARCGNTSLTPQRLPTSGEVYTETTIAVAPEAFNGSYQVALVTLQDSGGQSGRILAKIEEDVEIGDTVELIGVVESDDNPGPLFGKATSS
jgi:hypothetical protein